MITTPTLLIDCDGVLVDSEILGLPQAVTYVRTQGLDWREKDLVRLTGQRMDAVEQAFCAALLEKGVETEQAKAKIRAAKMLEDFVTIRRSRKHLLQPVKGALAFSQWVAAQNITRAVASSSQQKYLLEKMARLGLADFYAPHIYSADHVTHGKPAPDIFLYSAQQLGQDPSHCLVIEDSAHGVRAGVAAGMRVWGFCGGGHCYEGHGAALQEAGAVRVFDDFETLQQALLNEAAY